MAETEKVPAAVDVLAPIIRRHVKNNCYDVWPEHIPRPEFKAAQWWMEHQEKPTNAEHLEPIYDHFGNLKAWKTPYHDRVSYTLRKFLAMTELEQRAVIACIAEGIAYRGDDYDFFMDIVHHHRAYKRNPEAFKARAQELMQQGWQKSMAREDKLRDKIS